MASSTRWTADLCTEMVQLMTGTCPGEPLSEFAYARQVFRRNHKDFGPFTRNSLDHACRRHLQKTLKELCDGATPDPIPVEPEPENPWTEERLRHAAKVAAEHDIGMARRYLSEIMGVPLADITPRKIRDACTKYLGTSFGELVAEYRTTPLNLSRWELSRLAVRAAEGSTEALLAELASETGISYTEAQLDGACLNAYQSTFEELVAGHRARLDAAADLELPRDKRHKIPIEVLHTLFSQMLHHCNSLPLVPAPKYKHGQSKRIQVAMMDTSDVHLGSRVDPDEVNGVAEFSSAIAFKRLDRKLEGASAIIETQRRGEGTHQLREIHLNMLGDLVDGETIFKNHGAEIDAPLWMQITELGHRFGQRLLNWALENFDKVYVHGVVGNHGRLTRKGEGNLKSNADFIVYKLWEQLYRDNPRIVFHVDDGGWTTYSLFDRVHWLSHGDTIKSWAGIPFYGAIRDHGRDTDLIDDTIWGYHIGHHHQPITIRRSNGGFLSINGSYPGGSNFTVNTLHARGPACQWLRTLDCERLIGEWNIELADPIKHVSPSFSPEEAA